MAERGTKYWNERQHSLNSFERSLYLNNVDKDDTLDYSCGGELVENTERRHGNKTVICGPLIDGYLKQHGLSTISKLGRNIVSVSYS